MKEPFIRLVRSGWPERIHAEVFALGEREVLGEWESDARTPEEWRKDMEDLSIEVVKSNGLRVGEWQDIGPCCREAAIIT